MTKEHFSVRVPTFQWAWDATSIDAFARCPKYYQYTIIEGWRFRNLSPHLIFGLAFHKMDEIFCAHLVQGMSYSEALHQTFFDMLQETEGWESDHASKNRVSLLRSLVWYFENYAKDPAEVIVLPNGKPALEVSFRFYPGFSIEGIQILLCGHFDKLVTVGGSTFVVDKKTSGSGLDAKFFRSIALSNQMFLYYLAGRVVIDPKLGGIIIDGAQIGAEYTRFARGTITKTMAQLVEWLEDLRFLLAEAFRCAERGHWPMNFSACDKYGGCPFRLVCEQDACVRKHFLAADFRKELWEPLTAR